MTGDTNPAGRKQFNRRGSNRRHEHPNDIRKRYEYLAGEARRSGDIVGEQSCLQHAEHWLRVAAGTNQ